ncbi:DUF7408 domain-containing protein [Lihuaxuella thermophila]|nr:hypothetical protein [Lihuaxuella thermophila]
MLKVRSCFRNWLLLLIAGWMLVLPAGQLEAAPQKVDIRVEPGWKGEYKGEFVPVRIQLSASGNVSGEVSVELPNQKWSQQKPVAYPLEKVELPAGSTKEITLIVPNQLARPDAVIVFKSGQVLMGSQIMGGKRLGNNDLTIGILSDDPQSAAPFHKAVGSGTKNKSIHTYPLNAKEIPSQGRALSGFDVLIINRLASESLTPAQIRAIHLWVSQGGKLLIGGGNQASASVRGLESLLPVELTGKTVSVSDLSSLSLWATPPQGPLTISQSKLKEGSRLLAAGGGEVLLAQRDLGQGKIYYAGYDLATESLIDWPGNEKLWGQEVLFVGLGQNHPQGRIGGAFEDLWGLKTALNQMPHFRLPSISTLIVVFALYLLLVGPVIYWIFARMKKHEWNWLAVPVIGILTAMGLFLYGNHLRGNAVLVHNIGIVHADDHGGASIHGATAMVSQEADDYVLQAADGFLWPLELESFSPKADGGHGVSFQNGASIQYKNVPQWSKRDAYVEQVAQIGGELTGTITRQNHQLIGEVKNGTRLKLKQVQVMMGSRALLIGDLAPGAVKRFTAPDSMNWQTRLRPEQMGLKDRELELYRQFLFNPALMPVSNLDVIGWTEEPLLHVRVKGRKINESNLYLVKGIMRMEADASGKLMLPFGVIPSRVIESTDRIYGDGYTETIAMENSGTITFEYALDSYRFAQIDRLDVQSAGRTEEIYDWKSGEWKPVSAMNPKSPSSYLSPDHRVRIRIQIQAHQMSGKPMIAVEGRVKK